MCMSIYDEQYQLKYKIRLKIFSPSSSRFFFFSLKNLIIASSCTTVNINSSEIFTVYKNLRKRIK